MLSDNAARFRFSLRDLMLVILLVGLSLGWLVDRSRLKSELVRLQISHPGYDYRKEAIADLVSDSISPMTFSCLLYALTDPDPKIWQMAEQRLKELSGNHADFESLPVDDDRRKLVLIERLLDWYLAKDHSQDPWQ